VSQYQDLDLESRGICVTQRYEKGGDIKAACGQLAFLRKDMS
jgi:adenine C2-methylase RlmN of 23S rRNA A2503 and tRNA A37